MFGTYEGLLLSFESAPVILAICLESNIYVKSNLYHLLSVVFIYEYRYGVLFGKLIIVYKIRFC